MGAKDLEARLQSAGLSGDVWGIRGDTSVQNIERELNVTLEPDLRAFVEQVGNLRVDPFSIILAGDESGRLSAITETRELWRRTPLLEQLKAIKLTEHAGECYIHYPDGSVAAYDSFRPLRGEETLQWRSFREFFDWLFEEAGRISRGHAGI